MCFSLPCACFERGIKQLAYKCIYISSPGLYLYMLVVQTFSGDKIRFNMYATIGWGESTIFDLFSLSVFLLSFRNGGIRFHSLAIRHNQFHDTRKGFFSLFMKPLPEKELIVCKHSCIRHVSRYPFLTVEFTQVLRFLFLFFIQFA